LQTKLPHIILALVLLIGSAGLVVNKHYCQNQLKSTAFFLKAKACHQVSKQRSCPMHADMAEHSGIREHKGCCDDETEYLKADEDQIVSSFAWQLKRPIPVRIDRTWPEPPEWPSSDRQTLHYLNYKPPLIVCDLPVALQTFLF
jgi:hypothetical protein